MTKEMCVRSPAFDLLFEDSQHARVETITPYLEDVARMPAQSGLHRVTIFLTYGCNLSCGYCKTIVKHQDELLMFPQKGSVFSYAAFTTMLEKLHPTSIEHLHFTGGEPALSRDLPQMIRQAKIAGVHYCSMTSNGTLPFKIYAAALDQGLDEIRISLDAADPALGHVMSGGKKHAWARAVETIRALAHQREQGVPFFLLANAVISEANRHEMAHIVEFILGLGVGDLRLLCVADQKETLWDFPEAEQVIRDIHQIVDAYPPQYFPLLRTKLLSVFAPEETGLRDVRPPQGKAWRCYIPLTERTYDGMFYYPCSNYLREGGAPLGPLGDTWDEQYQKTVQFVQSFDPLMSPLCQQFCSHCTQSFNRHANAARQRVVEEGGSSMSDTRV